MDVKLVMFKPDGQRKDIPLVSPATIIGRGESCELRVPLLAVSRRHCEVTLEGDELQVKDLASSNGTYVNNNRVNEMALEAGDRLTIGPVVFTVQIDGDPEEINPPPAALEQTEMEGEAGEEVVDLEADVIEESAERPTIATLDLEPDSDDEELDPIAALEALAAESEEKEDEEK